MMPQVIEKVADVLAEVVVDNSVSGHVPIRAFSG